MSHSILIPIYNQAITDQIFSIHETNPGIGGTDFSNIKLALYLAKERPDYKIYPANHNQIKIREKPPNIITLDISVQKLFEHKIFSSNQTILLAPAAFFFVCLKSGTRIPACKIICWLRHPFNYNFHLISNQISAYVSVDTYAYHSNNIYYKPHWHIPNLFIIPPSNHTSSSLKTITDSLDLVYLGALFPAKGFHHIAAKWSSIKSIHNNTRLHVIGSSQTYGRATENDLIPTTTSYARKIISLIDEQDIRNKKVIFYGNMGKEKFDVINKCHIALLNPTGSSEAFPASTLECMSKGVPVIASNDYGMFDTMQFFPESSVNMPSEIPNKLNMLVSNPFLYRELQARSLSVASYFQSQTEEILLRWQHLIELVARSANIENHPPASSIQGIKRGQLRWRQAQAFYKMIERRLKGKI